MTDMAPDDNPGDQLPRATMPEYLHGDPPEQPAAGEQQAQPIPDALEAMLPPVNLAVQVSPAPAAGKQIVVVVVQNMHGQFELALTARQAINLANSLKTAGREALTGLAVVDQASAGGLIVPGR